MIAMHYEIDFSEHYLAEYMAARGIGFLGWNTRFRGAGAYFLFEPAIVDVGAGVQWLREQGVETVVLLGNSGGASLGAAYQSRAGDRADLFVSLNAHAGRPEVLTRWIDPSVTDELDPFAVDPSLDMFSNGPPYDAAFVERYRAAQRVRNARISAWARAEMQRGERMFCVHRTWADLRFLDPSIDPSDRKPGCYAGDPRRANFSPFGIARTCTLRTWLDMWSLDGSHGLDDLATITEPALVVQSTADKGCFPSDARTIFDALGSSDKELEFVTGEHYLDDPPEARESVADLIAEWVRSKT
jgi:pimeloyl-ACP methyl ester carboxylesterase